MSGLRLRIVGGKWKGRTIESPDGRETTRPTTERTRERVASMVLSARGLDLTGASVLDAFAGSGSMGFELLSRGAAHATFVDNDKRCAERIRKAARSLGASSEEVNTVCGDVFIVTSTRLPASPFDVVFLDPPYVTDANRVSAAVSALGSTGQLADGALVVYEHATGTPGLECIGLALDRSRAQGTTTVDLLIWEGESQGQ